MCLQKIHLNSNIEIHKCMNKLHPMYKSERNLNSNIEIHKSIPSVSLKMFSFSFKF